jgi:hypothetical protein
MNNSPNWPVILHVVLADFPPKTYLRSAHAQQKQINVTKKYTVPVLVLLIYKKLF